MILTTYNEPHNHLLQTVIGPLDLEELTEAIRKASTHVDAPVLWDLREVPFSGTADTVKAQVPKIVAMLKSQMSDHKRAFVVNTPEQLDFLHDLIGGTTAPWPWALFTNYQEALAWISG